MDLNKISSRRIQAMFSAGLVITYLNIRRMSREMCPHQAVKTLPSQTAMPILTERGLGVQDEFVWKQITKFCETRCRAFSVEVPVNCRAAYVCRSLRVTQYL
jgi:hypothetical protein